MTDKFNPPLTPEELRIQEAMETMMGRVEDERRARKRRADREIARQESIAKDSLGDVGSVGKIMAGLGSGFTDFKDNTGDSALKMTSSVLNNFYDPTGERSTGRIDPHPEWAYKFQDARNDRWDLEERSGMMDDLPFRASKFIASAIPQFFFPTSKHPVVNAMVNAGLSLTEPANTATDRMQNAGMAVVAGLAGDAIGKRWLRSRQAREAEKVKRIRSSADSRKLANKARSGNDGEHKKMKIPASETYPEHFGNKMVVRAVGRDRMNSVVAEHNQPIIDDLAKKWLGATEDEILSGNPIRVLMDDYKKKWSEIYNNIGTSDALKSIGGFKVSAQLHEYFDELEKISKKSIFDEVNKAKIKPDVIKQFKNDLMSSADSEAWFDALKQIREMQRNAQRAVNLEPTVTVGMKDQLRALSVVKNAIEDMIEKNLRANGLDEAWRSFKEAREGLARIHVLEDAVGQDGVTVIPKALSDIRRNNNGRKFQSANSTTHEADYIADLYDTFPHVFISSQKPGGLMPTGLEVLGGQSQFLHGHPVAGAATLGTRPFLGGMQLNSPIFPKDESLSIPAAIRLGRKEGRDIISSLSDPTANPRRFWTGAMTPHEYATPANQALVRAGLLLGDGRLSDEEVKKMSEKERKKAMKEYEELSETMGLLF